MNVSSEHLNVQAEELKARIIENEKLQAEVINVPVHVHECVMYIYIIYITYIYRFLRFLTGCRPGSLKLSSKFVVCVCTFL